MTAAFLLMKEVNLNVLKSKSNIKFENRNSFFRHCHLKINFLLKKFLGGLGRVLIF